MSTLYQGSKHICQSTK